VQNNEEKTLMNEQKEYQEFEKTYYKEIYNNSADTENVVKTEKKIYYE